MSNAAPTGGRDGQSRAQKRASLSAPLRVIQKFKPSLHAPNGPESAPVEKEPSGVRSAAFHKDTLLPLKLVTSMRSPSNAAARGPLRPLPVSVASTNAGARGFPTASLTRTTITEFVVKLGTQMFVPSKLATPGPLPILIV